MAAVSCSSGHDDRPTLGDDPLGAVAAAMRRAGSSGRISGTTAGPTAGPSGTVRGVWKGGITGEGDVNVGFVSRTGTQVPVELRWLAKQLYYKRAVTTVSAGDQLVLFTRDARFPPWRTALLTGRLTSGIVEGIPSAFSPAALVSWLQKLRVGVTERDGARAGVPNTTRLTSKHGVFVGTWSQATVDLFVDQRHRVVEVRITSPTGGTTYRVSAYGTPVHVTAPPAAQISTKSEVPPIEPAGPFTTVASGTSAGVTWAVQRAPGTRETVCWRWQAQPPLTQAQLKTPDTPRCMAPVPDHPDDPSDTVQFVVDGTAQGPYDALAVLLPAGVKGLTLGFVGGKTQSLPVTEPVTVWVGPGDPTKAYLGVTLADGTHLDCGAGAVSEQGDLADPRLTEDVGTAAWGCIPPG
jgi:hypothetical protein